MLSSVRHCVDSSAGEDKMSQIKRLRCFVVGCNNEYSSHHLLPTSEPLKTQRINITFVLKWMRCSPICLNASMFARIICDPSTEVSIRVFNDSLQIVFPNNMLVSQFCGWSKQYCSSPHGREGRGQQSSLAFKETCYLLKTNVLVLIIMFITLKSCVLNHISLNFWYTVFWVHTSEAHGPKAAVTACE